MQFYLDGYAPGDPDILPAAPGAEDRPAGPPDAADVLIVGAGPAGMLLAAQLSSFPSIRTCIVERREGPLKRGQADGVACRTVEMFEAFGLSERLDRGNPTGSTRPCSGVRRRTIRPEIVRTGRVQDVEDGLSEFPHVIVNQARLLQYLQEYMAKSPTRLVPDFGWEFETLTIDARGDYPVSVTLRNVATNAAKTVRAKYVVGCDGARSKVREAIGAAPNGDFANHAWGVVDMLAVTDFPDIRLKAAIQSKDEGNILLIPREGGYLVRLYVDMGEIDPNNREAFRSHTQESVIATAQRVLHPYTLDVRDVAWFAVYQVGQRVTDRFDDVPASEAGSRPPRVFIAGDACHTHSAKAGQGMNVSLQDAFNLGWKIASVLEGRAKPELLAHLYGRAPRGRPAPYRLRQGMVENHGVAAQGPGAAGARRGRPRRAAGVFREVGPLYGRRRDALSAGRPADRRNRSIRRWPRASRSACASTRRPSFASRTPSRCSLAMPRAPTAPGASTLSPTPTARSSAR